MQSLKYILLLATVGVAAYWILPSRSSRGNVSRDTTEDVMYLCRETKQRMQAPPQQVPAMNPQTGRATLYRALYCAECKGWRAVPPPELYPGNPLTYRCPKHHRQMTSSGLLENN